MSPAEAGSGFYFQCAQDSRACVRTVPSLTGLGSTSHFTQHSAFGYVLGYYYSALRARFSFDPFHTQTKTLVLTQTLESWANLVPP